MRRLVVSEWITLDGIFDADAMDQWFTPYHSDARGECIQEGIMASDALLLGRVSYEMLAAYWPNLKNNEFGIAGRLNSMPKYIVSSTLKNAEWSPSTIIKENVVDEVARLKQQPGQNILVTGSATLVQSLMKADLVDEYRFLVHPIIMGSGKRFFKEGMDMTKLEVIESKQLGMGVNFLRYQPARG